MEKYMGTVIVPISVVQSVPLLYNCACTNVGRQRADLKQDNDYHSALPVCM